MIKREETKYEKYVKRPIDFLGACAAITLLGVPMIVIACSVKKNLGCPVLYSATRIGKNEKPFKMYKFRSMTDEKDEEGNLLPDAQRMTEFGNFLRNTSLDELPEIFSILKGDMAFIGPRPMPVSYLPYFTEEESIRHTCRGGMSGLAQVNGRKDFMLFFETIKKVIKRDNVGAPDEGENVDLFSIRNKQRPLH